MKKILLSLPQVEWSCFLASHVCGCLFDILGKDISIDVIAKNNMDWNTFPYVGGRLSPISINQIDKKYSLAFNFDSDNIVSRYMSEKHSSFDMEECIYGSSNSSIWNLTTYFMGIAVGSQKVLNSDVIKSTDLWNGGKVYFDLNLSIKVRPNRSESGVAIRNDLLRMYVKNAFFADNDRLWHIPVRSNLAKRYAECNAVKSIVTDDVFCALSGYSMGKGVVFLKTHEMLPDISIEDKLYIQDVSDFVNAISS